MSKNSLLSCIWVAFTLVVNCGCGAGGPEIASVEGTVTMDGKPLPMQQWYPALLADVRGRANR